MARDCDLLSRCYESCLELAVSMICPIHCSAVPSTGYFISTGRAAVLWGKPYVSWRHGATSDRLYSMCLRIRTRGTLPGRLTGRLRFATGWKTPYNKGWKKMWGLHRGSPYYFTAGQVDHWKFWMKCPRTGDSPYNIWFAFTDERLTLPFCGLAVLADCRHGRRLIKEINTDNV